MESVLGASRIMRGRVGLREDQVERIAVEQREAARLDYRERISLDDNVAPGHHEVFIRALRNVLATQLALFSFAQIIDGVPTADVGLDRRDHGLEGDHPLEEHQELCPGAVDKARELRRSWESESSKLKFNPELVRSYRSTSEGTKQFNTRLIELVAVAIHQLAAHIFKMKLNLHQGDVDRIVFWTRPKPPDWNGDWYEIPPRPTIFNHPGYHESDVYPEAEADMVGYWAEDRILGGVPAFNRKAESEKTAVPPNVYFHACRRKVTQRIFQLRDDQQEALTGFLLADTDSPPPEPCPLPILGDSQNRERIDVHEAIILHGVYRDSWERKPWTREQERFHKRRPKAEIDYPQMRDMVEYMNSQPLSADRTQFSQSGKPCDSFFEEVGLPTPWKKDEETEAHGNTGGAPDDIASTSAREEEPSSGSRGPRSGEGLEQGEPVADEAPGEKLDWAHKEDSGEEGHGETDTPVGAKGNTCCGPEEGDGTPNEEVELPRKKKDMEAEPGSSDLMGNGDGRGEKRRRLR